MTTNFKFSATVVAATVAACIGKRMGFETLREVTLEHGTAGLDAFAELCRQEFLARGVHNAKRESFALMQKDKCPGVSTFYTYLGKIRQLAVRIEKGDAKAADELLALTANKACAGKGKGKAGASASAKPAAEAPAPLTVDAAVAFLQAAHKAGALNPLHYAALQALTCPAPVRAPVKHMGDVVEVQTPALQAA